MSSPEPWVYDEVLDALYDAHNSHIAECGNVNTDDAARIVQCVNFCAGVPNERLEQLKNLKALTQGVTDAREELQKVRQEQVRGQTQGGKEAHAHAEEGEKMTILSDRLADFVRFMDDHPHPDAMGTNELADALGASLVAIPTMQGRIGVYVENVLRTAAGRLRGEEPARREITDEEVEAFNEGMNSFFRDIGEVARSSNIAPVVDFEEEDE